MGSVGSEGAVSESGIQVTSPQPLIPDPWFRLSVKFYSVGNFFQKQ